MSARLLVVDDNPLNVKLLAAKLTRDYYYVSTAENGVQAMQMAVADQPDLILLDVMMPEIDGFEVCRRLKANSATAHIPIIMVTALSDLSDRVHGLEAGADDFLTKPINDIALMARVRSLLRLKMMMDEWRRREATAAEFAVSPAPQIEPDCGGCVMLLEDDPEDRRTVQTFLESNGLTVSGVDSVQGAIEEAQRGTFDLVMTSLDLQNDDGLLLCGQLRAREATRTLPILLMANENEIDQVAKGLDLGANDYLLRPIEGSELIARARTQLRQKHHYDRLRHNYEQSLSLALVDPLTGAFNRRYLDAHLPKMMGRFCMDKHPMSLLYFDIDFFKKINDTYGHAVGDIVLKEVVRRVTQSLRPLDLVVRAGGEEFIAIMPESELKTAMAVGERLRAAIADVPFFLPGYEKPLSVTISIGVASIKFEQGDTADDILKRADAALYKAKQEGRDKVVGENEPHS